MTHSIKSTATGLAAAILLTACATAESAEKNASLTQREARLAEELALVEAAVSQEIREQLKEGPDAEALHAARIEARVVSKVAPKVLPTEEELRQIEIEVAAAHAEMEAAREEMAVAKEAAAAAKLEIEAAKEEIEAAKLEAEKARKKVIEERARREKEK